MKKTLVIGNIINLPVDLINFAIKTAKEISGELKAYKVLFLQLGHPS
jgi:hypothetical protein